MINLTIILAYFGIGLKGGHAQNIQGKLIIHPKKIPKACFGNFGLCAILLLGLVDEDILSAGTVFTIFGIYGDGNRCVARLDDFSIADDADR